MILSLVGLKAVDIVKSLSEYGGSFEIGSYGKPICTVIPFVSNKDDLVDSFFMLSRKLNCNNYIIVEKPKNRSELVTMFKELERELKDENKAD